MAVTTPAVGPWVFVRLKLRLMANGLRGRSARVALFVLGIFFSGLFAVGGYAAFAVPGVLDNERAVGIMLPLGGTLIVLGWTLFPLVFFGVDESLDPARFALLPLRRRVLIVGFFTAAMAGLPAIATLAATAGMVHASARLDGPGAALAQLAGVILGLFLCVAISRAVTSAFATSLRSRRSRDLAAVLLAVLAALIGPLQLALVAGAEKADWDRVATVTDVLSWTPFGAPYSLGLDVAAGRAWAVPVKLLIVLAAIGGLLWWWSRTLERAMLGAATAGSRASGTVRGTPVDALLFRWLPRNRFGALMARELRYWWRETRRRAGLITFAVVALFLPLSLSASGGGPGAMVLFVGGLAAIALANQFGYEGSAYAANVVAGVPGRLEIQSRAAAHAVWVLPLLVVVSVVVGLFDANPARIPSTLGLLVASYGVGLGLVLPISVRAAFALPESTNPFAMNSGGGAAKGFLTLGVMAGAIVIALPLQIVSLFLRDVWVWIGLPVGIAYGVAAYLIGSGIAGEMLDKRAPEVLAAVTQNR